jgi:hypothetical protein
MVREMLLLGVLLGTAREPARQFLFCITAPIHVGGRDRIA